MCSIFWSDHIAVSEKVEKEPSKNILNKLLVLAERKYTIGARINTPVSQLSYCSRLTKNTFSESCH